MKAVFVLLVCLPFLFANSVDESALKAYARLSPNERVSSKTRFFLSNFNGFLCNNFFYSDLLSEIYFKLFHQYSKSYSKGLLSVIILLMIIFVVLIILLRHDINTNLCLLFVFLVIVFQLFKGIATYRGFLEEVGKHSSKVLTLVEL